MLGSTLSVALLASAPFLETEPPYRLAFDARIDGAVAGAGLATWIATETIFFKALAPAACRWCDRAADGTDTLNALDAWGRGIRWSPSAQPIADVTSSVVAFAVLPAALLGLELFHTRRLHYSFIATDVLIVAESAVLAQLVDQAVKFTVARQRPYAHFRPPDQAPNPPDPNDNISFFSGHSTLAFALTVGFGTVAHLRGYPWAWLVWAIGLPIAAAVPILRMGADQHYLTDVLVGSAVGAAFGWGVPTLFHRRLSLSPAPGGLALSATF